jgi:hypothetical protein
MPLRKKEIRENVGHILIRSKDTVVGRKLFTEIDGWLDESGWKHSSTISVSFDQKNEKTRVELIPGAFQSNGPKIVDLTMNPSFTGLREELHGWFWEIL